MERTNGDDSEEIMTAEGGERDREKAQGRTASSAGRRNEKKKNLFRKEKGSGRRCSFPPSLVGTYPRLIDVVLTVFALEATIGNTKGY